ncbi:phage tail protein [Vibrio antiquarius]|uniref:phage tail protein n=1 Tax=Vibrio antiquarius (strain Ex25) TaxID=150340 RepID=UPI00265B1D70|nr:phage tail protein [Vibrio antiquarius]MCR9549021.1 phage tail protein [Vibrio antiquarius]
MSAKYYTILTETGKIKVANAAALGRQIKLTHLAIGDGNGSEYDPVESQTELKKENYRTPISNLGTDTQNQNWVIAEGMIPVDVGGWFVREVGLFDEDGDLFAIGKYPETYKPTLAEGTGRDLYIRFIMVVSNTDTIDMKIDPTVAIATRGWVETEFISAKGGSEGDVLVKNSSDENDVKWIRLSDYEMTNHPVITMGEQAAKLLLHQPEDVYQVITKKARNAGGYVMMTYQKTSAEPDASNEFGNSHHRPTTVYDVTHAIVGRLKPSDSVAEKIELSQAFNAGVLGLPSLSTVDYSKYNSDPDAPSFNSLTPWNITRDGDYVEFLLNGEFTLLFARSPGSTSSVIVEEQLPDGTYQELGRFSLKYDHNNKGEDAAFQYKGVTSVNKLSKIRIRNNEALAHCYLYGANIVHLKDLKGENLLVDTAAYIRDDNYYYIESAGANDFAFKRNNSKWFGSYHGGHHSEVVRRYVQGGVYEQHLDGYFEVTDRLMFTSISELHSEGLKEFDVSVETQFFDGGYINYVSINIADGRVGVECTDVYTSMTCTDTVFTHLEFPKYVDVSSYPSSKVILGNNNMVTQVDMSRHYRVTSQMTLFTTNKNQYGGLRIDKAAGYNKVYYGPILSNKTESYPPAILSDLSFVTTKEFY